MRARTDQRHSSQITQHAKRALPNFIEPSLATLRDRAPSGDLWIHEIKFDGYRAQAHLRDGKATLYTRRGYDWSDRFSSIAESIDALPAKNLILDGEVVVPDERGLADYHRLQEDLARRRADRLVYYVFDLLFLNGEDLRSLPLIERKELLAKLLAKKPSSRIVLSQHIEADGTAVFEGACEMQAEGIVSKLKASPYRSGRQESWVKIKCTKSDSYPIIAFVEKLGAQPRRIASLYIGRHDGNRLLYAGKVKTGYTEIVLRELRERLDPFIRKTSPLSAPIKKPKATWVEPVLEAEVRFSGVTSDGILREAVYTGLRDDLAPASIIQQAPRRAGARKPPYKLGVPKENILQLLPDAVVPTPEELKTYWRNVAKRALKYLARRPLKLVRHVHGTTFYHKGPLPPVPASVHQLKIQKREGGEGTRLWVDDLEGLLGLVDIGVVEVHAWNATVDDLEHADVLVFDFDPGEGVGYDFVVESALAMRELLNEEGFDSWPKLTGGKGIHVMVPLQERMTHDDAHAYARRLAQRLAAKDPKRYTISAALSARRGRLFIDYLRNGRGTTAVGTYSPRARAGFPIAVPVTWKDVQRAMRPDAFNMLNSTAAQRSFKG